METAEEEQVAGEGQSASRQQTTEQPRQKPKRRNKNDNKTHVVKGDKAKTTSQKQTVDGDQQSSVSLEESDSKVDSQKQEDGLSETKIEIEERAVGESNSESPTEDKDQNTVPTATTTAPTDQQPAASGAHDQGEDDDNDEDGDPIPSGTGAVSRDCSASDLVGWSEILPKWHSKLYHRPKGLDPLVRAGIPEPLRGEVWQLLAGAEQCLDLMDRYRIFLTQSAPTEQIILRDVHRTYPAHENFRSDGTGSNSLLDSLFKVCKAYAVYDEEVGYCQGLSFLVAALLLHMPEEQAFCVFVRIMQHYGLRDLFRNNFDELYLKFYQLERLLEDHMPDLHQHFVQIGIEPFTYASQWFLTVFTAKFPLNAVFYIMDIFLLDGMNTIFQIALALLGSSKQELLALDFEGVLKFFRVQMPKRYRNQENVQQLIVASSAISLRKLKKHAKQYEIVKQKEKLLENPLTRLQKENAKLTENNLRLEQENDDLARDLVASKIQLRAQLDVLEDRMETLNRALTYSRQNCQTYLSTISDVEDEKGRLEVEVCQLKEVCRRELNRAETELARDSSIISDYKKITSQLSKRLDKQVEIIEKFIIATLESLNDSKLCKEKSCHKLFQVKGEELLDKLKNIDSQLGVDSKTGNDNSSEQSSPTVSNTPSGDLQQPQSSPKMMQKISAESQMSNRPVGAYIKSKLIDSPTTSSETKIEQLTKHIDDLEIELAKTKLALVEAECKCQQLTHDLNLGVAVKTSGSEASGSLIGKLDSLKAAVSSSTKRSPRSSGNIGNSTFAKINNLISEKILATTVSQSYYQQQVPPMTSQPATTMATNFLAKVPEAGAAFKSGEYLTGDEIISGYDHGEGRQELQKYDSNAGGASPLLLPISTSSINNGADRPTAIEENQC